MDSEYWEKRIANETWKTYNNVEEKNRDLIEMYNASLESIKKELYALAEKAEKDGALGRTDKYRFDKLLGQKGHIYKEIERLGEEFEKTSKERIFNVGKEVSSNVFESLGIKDYSMPNKKVMEQMLRSPWKGSFFSERLWRDLGKLESNLEGLIQDGISKGKTTTEMAIQLANAMNQSFNVAHRLVRSETINHMNRSALESYKNAGIGKVQWWAAEDERTCDQCGGNHGKIYDVKVAPILPCHTGCRCTWIPVIDDEKKFEIPKFGNNANKEASILDFSEYEKRLKISRIDTNGLNPDMLRDFLNQIETDFNNYPELVNSIDKIIQRKDLALGVSPDNSFSKYTLALNPKLFQNNEFATKSIERMIKNEIYPKGTTLKTILYHEYGHILEGKYIGRHYVKDQQNDAWNNCKAAKAVLQIASLECYNDPDQYANELSKISNYALVTESEGLAECIHVEIAGTGNSFTKKVLEILRR